MKVRRKREPMYTQLVKTDQGRHFLISGPVPALADDEKLYEKV